MFASEAWRRTNSSFYGNEECFVFQLHPEMKRYRCDPSTTRGRNRMYSKMDQMAMGGEVDFFALQLDESFLNGRSNRCETFHSPRLSKKAEFRIRAVECWGIVQPDYLEILRMKYARFKQENKGKSVLDRQEDVFFLDLLGKGYSHLQRD
jgi:TLD